MSDVKLSLDQVTRLLDGLESDDAFRALFVSDPAAALARVGAPVEASRCLVTRNLASKETLRAARLALTAQLVGYVEQKIFRLDANFTSATVTLPSTPATAAAG